jgi:hypothetical protein
MALACLLLEHFHDPALHEADLLARLAWLRDVVAPRLERYLGYYRNPMTQLADILPCSPSAGFLVKPWRQYQEIGLPARITGFRRAADGSSEATGAIDVQRKEVVIENDIAWRIDTLVDFAAGRLPGITSTAAEPSRRAILNHVIIAILDTFTGGTNGDGTLRLLQELVLQGAISGSAWIHIRPTELLLTRNGNDAQDSADLARWLTIEVVDARQVCPVGPYLALLRHSHKSAAMDSHANSIWQRMRNWFNRPTEPEAENFSFDLFGPNLWQRYDRGVLLQEAENPLGIVPFVRYDNAADPAAGTRVGPAGSGAVDAGLGDVEPLIGLQDELNTRLSDRAYRVTMTSFKMYLGKGIENFTERPIGPGQMWGTDNLDASIQAFGGDAATPSEDAHINEVREALDKISGVSPVAAGLIRGKLGNLTSAIALRLTLIALLARTERKRAALTKTLSEIVRVSLEMFDRAGVLHTAEDERGMDVNWPTALPESDMDRLNEARAKLDLGLPRDVVLRELGYGELVETGTANGANANQPAPADTAVGEGTGSTAVEGAVVTAGAVEADAGAS